MRRALRWRSVAVLAAGALSACGEVVIEVDPSPARAAWPAPNAWRPLPAGGVGVVTNNGDSTVTLIDLAEQRTFGTFPVGLEPLAVNGPHHGAVDPRSGVFYTPLAFPAPPIAPGPHAAHGSSVHPGILVKRALDGLRLQGQAALDPNPGDVLLSPDGALAFVTHFDLQRALGHLGDPPAQRSNLVVIETATMGRAASVPLCIAAHGLVLSPDARTLYVACYGDDALAVVDVSGIPAGRAPEVELVPLGMELAGGSPRLGPYSLVRSPDGATVWVGCFEDATVIPFDARTRRFDLARVSPRLPGRPLFPMLDADGTMLLPMQSRDGLARLSLGARVVVTAVRGYPAEQCVSPHQITPGPDGRLYLVCEGVHTGTRPREGTVLALDPTTLDVVTVFTAGLFPDGIVFAP